MRRLFPVLVFGLLLSAAWSTCFAQEMKGFRADLLGQMQYAQKEIMELENAIPQDKMTWRPNKEVRSISEVYLHLAFGNYLFANFAGVKPPAGISVSSPTDEAAWDKTTTDKAAIKEKLAKSFDFVIDALKNTPDENLENPVDFFGTKMNMRSIWLAELSHMHEHLGQSIAYARMNSIVPPWTAAQQAAEKAKKK
jgi:uncharacterized damage-inducible protein DinB